jgi:hypothetical protein
VVILRHGHLVYTQRMSELRRQHRIHARLTACLPATPESLQDRVALRVSNNVVVMDVPGDLAPVLGWLAELPLTEVTIERLGLRAVYDGFHGNGAMNEQRLRAVNVTNCGETPR